MNETGPGYPHVPLWLRALAATLPAGLLLSLSGFTRFDVPQTALSAVLLALLLVALAFRTRDSTPEESASAAFRWTIGVVVAWTVASALLRGASPAGLDDVALLALLGLATVVGATRGLAPALAGGYAAAGLAMAVVGVAQTAGVDIVPGIPNVTPDGVRLFGDDTRTGATAALLVASTLLALRPVAGRARLAADVGAGAAVVAAALAWPIAALAITSIAALAMAAAGVASGQRPGAALRLPALLLLAATLGSGVGSLARQDAGDTVPFVRRPAVPLMEAGPAEPWSADGALPFYLNASAQYALEDLAFGSGPGTFAGNVAGHADHESDFARNQPNGLPWVHRGPSALLQWSATLGAVVPLGVLAALLLALVTAIRARSGEAVGALAALGCLLIVGPGVHGGATLLALGVALGAATQSDRATAHRTHGGTRWLRAGLALVVLGLAVQTTRWSYQQAGGNVFLAAGRIPEATPWFERALALQDRYETHLNLGLIESMPTGEEHDFTVAVDHLTRAANLSPGHARAQFALGSIAVRTLGRIAEDPAEALRKRQAAMAVLRRATEAEPNHLDAGVLLAQTHIIGGEHDAGIAELERLDARNLPGEAARVVLEALGVFWADLREDPRKALEYFDRAELLPGDPARTTRLAERIQECRQWVVTGRRPQHEPGHSPFGDDHDHGGPGAPGAPSDAHDDHGDEGQPGAPAGIDPHAGHDDHGTEGSAGGAP